MEEGRVRVAARYFYWPRLSEGSRGEEKKEAFVAEQARMQREGAGKIARRVSQSGDFFCSDFHEWSNG